LETNTAHKSCKYGSFFVYCEQQISGD